MELFVFNPEHDYALADGNPHFVALRSAVKFSYDCALLLNLLTLGIAHVHNLYKIENEGFAKNFDIDCNPDEIDKVTPWGWDPAVRRHLLNAGVSPKLIPSDEQIANIRELAHRKTSVTALEYIRQNSKFAHLFPKSANIITDIAEIPSFVAENEHALFKSPYSGNGRGHLYAHHYCSPTLLRQCKGVIDKQGSILAERHLSVVQDFAMEFSIENGTSEFAGYSLFRTHRYAYDCNILMSDDKIGNKLCQYVKEEILEEVKSLIMSFLDSHIAPYYGGIVGVDMFVYQEDGVFKLQPFSEINIRRTMGFAAHEIFKLHCHKESEGVFRIVRSNKKGGLKAYIDAEYAKNNNKFVGNLWLSGFYALIPVNEETMYAPCIWLENQNDESSRNIPIPR